MSRFTDKEIEEKIPTIFNSDKQRETKSWNNGLGIKALVLTPSVFFLVSYYILYKPKTFHEILGTFLYPLIFISLGVILLFIMEK